MKQGVNLMCLKKDFLWFQEEIKHNKNIYQDRELIIGKNNKN